MDAARGPVRAQAQAPVRARGPVRVRGLVQGRVLVLAAAQALGAATGQVWRRHRGICKQSMQV